MKITIEDVARTAGVSRSTVSRVMNEAPGVAEAVRSHVRDVITRLRYVPDQTARALATRQRSAVDVIVVAPLPGVRWVGAHPYYGRVLAGVMTELDRRDVRLRVHMLSDPDDHTAVDAVAEQVTMGAVLADAPPSVATRLGQHGRRVVSLVATAAPVPAIEADNAGGAYAAVRHLHQLGRRRIAAIHGPADTSCAVNRRAGHRRAIDELGLDDLSDGGRFRRDAGFDAARRLLETHPDIDAMFVACDLMATGAIQAITATGRRVPQDVSVVGFDDSIAAVCSNPALTTMRMPVEDMAAAATRLLLRGPVAPNHRETFPVSLILRQSTAPLVGVP